MKVFKTKNSRDKTRYINVAICYHLIMSLIKGKFVSFPGFIEWCLRLENVHISKLFTGILFGKSQGFVILSIEIHVRVNVSIFFFSNSPHIELFNYFSLLSDDSDHLIETSSIQLSEKNNRRQCKAVLI